MTTAFRPVSIVFLKRGESVVQVPQNCFLLSVVRQLRCDGAFGYSGGRHAFERAGFEICLIDSTITPNYKKRVLEEVRDALCLGISLVTGPMIRETVEIARAIKEWNPEFPIILGGWHPSLLPKQTLEAPYIDYVVRGQGEDSLLELVNHIEKGSAPDFVAGIGFKRDNKLIFTPERPLRPLVDMPPKAYHLADFDAYERLCGKRWAMYTSSLACPFNCAYCTNAGSTGASGTPCRRSNL